RVGRRRCPAFSHSPGAILLQRARAELQRELWKVSRKCLMAMAWRNLAGRGLPERDRSAVARNLIWIYRSGDRRWYACSAARRCRQRPGLRSREWRRGRARVRGWRQAEAEQELAAGQPWE